MIRRQTRLRKEYLYKKALEERNKDRGSDKAKLLNSLSTGKAVPTELRNDQRALAREIELDDENSIEKSQSIDDEYAFCGVNDPHVVVTTSHDPSSRLMQFAKEVKLLLPNSSRVNRGTLMMKDLLETCINHEATDIVMLHEHRGEPNGLIVSHLPHGPTAYFTLTGVVMRHDIKGKIDKVSEEYPHLIFDNFNSTLGERTIKVLKHLFPVPKESARRVMTFVNTLDTISFRHHNYKIVSSDSNHEKPKDVVLKEAGPRFEMKLYHIKLGTIDNEAAETEWVNRPFMNTARKRTFL